MFSNLKSRFTCTPVLNYSYYFKDFYTACDKSNVEIGAVLLQKGEERLMPKAYTSRTLNTTEQSYIATDRECLAIVFGLKNFRITVLGYEVHIITDHKPILEVLKKRTFTNN